MHTNEDVLSMSKCVSSLTKGVRLYIAGNWSASSSSARQSLESDFNKSPKKGSQTSLDKDSACSLNLTSSNASDQPSEERCVFLSPQLFFSSPSDSFSRVLPCRAPTSLKILSQIDFALKKLTGIVNSLVFHVGHGFWRFTLNYSRVKQPRMENLLHSP